MSAQGAIRAGGAFVSLFTESSGLDKGLADAAKKLKSWGKTISSVGARVFAMGALVRAPFELATKMFTDTGASLTAMSARTGIGIEALSALSFAADQAGVSSESLEHGFRHAQKSVYEAAAGSKEATEAFTALGLSVSELSGLAPDAQFRAMADALSKVENPTQRAAEAMKIFGRGGTELLPLLNMGAAGIDQLTRKAEELGIVMSSADAQSAATFKRELGALWAQIKAVGFQVGAAVVPAMREFFAQVSPVITSTIAWARENRGLVALGAKLAGGIVVLGGAILGLGVAITYAGIVASALSIGLGLAGAALDTILSPIGLVVAAVGGLGYALNKTGAAGAAFDKLKERFPQIGQAVAYVGAKFNELKDTALEAWSGISAALSSGDISAAANVAFLGIKLGWYQLTEDLVQPFADAKAKILSGWEEIAAFAKTKFIAVKIYWTELVSFLGEELDRATAEIRAAWNLVTAGFHVAVTLMKPYWTSFVNFVSDTWDSLMKDVAGRLKAALEAVARINPVIAGTVAVTLKGLDDMLSSPTGQNAKKHLEAAAEAASGPEAQAERDRIAAEKQGRLDAIEADRAGAKEHEQALADAKAELAAAVAAANAARKKPGLGQSPAAAGAPYTGPTKADSAGTFAGLAAERIGGGGSDAAQTARNTQLCAERLNRLIQVMQAGGFVFG